MRLHSLPAVGSFGFLLGLCCVQGCRTWQEPNFSTHQSENLESGKFSIDKRCSRALELNFPGFAVHVHQKMDIDKTTSALIDWAASNRKQFTKSALQSQAQNCIAAVWAYRALNRWQQELEPLSESNLLVEMAKYANFSDSEFNAKKAKELISQLSKIYPEATAFRAEVLNNTLSSFTSNPRVFKTLSERLEKYVDFFITKENSKNGSSSETLRQTLTESIGNDPKSTIAAVVATIRVRSFMKYDIHFSDFSNPNTQNNNEKIGALQSLLTNSSFHPIWLMPGEPFSLSSFFKLYLSQTALVGLTDLYQGIDENPKKRGKKTPKVDSAELHPIQYSQHDADHFQHQRLSYFLLEYSGEAQRKGEEQDKILKTISSFIESLIEEDPNEKSLLPIAFDLAHERRGRTPPVGTQESQLFLKDKLFADLYQAKTNSSKANAKFKGAPTSFYTLLHPCVFSLFSTETEFSEFIHSGEQDQSILSEYKKVNWKNKAKKFWNISKRQCDASSDALKTEIQEWKANSESK